MLARTVNGRGRLVLHHFVCFQVMPAVRVSELCWVLTKYRLLSAWHNLWSINYIRVIRFLDTIISRTLIINAPDNRHWNQVPSNRVRIFLSKLPVTAFLTFRIKIVVFH